MAADLLMPLVFLSSLVFLLLGFLKKKKRLPLPPGPPTLPLIGHMHIMDQLTHRGLARLANKYGGIMYLRLGFMPTVVVSSPDAAKEVLKEQDGVFSNRPATLTIRYLTYGLADMAFANYGPFWRQMRKLCVMKLFSRKRAESWASVRHEIDGLIRTLAAGAGTTVNLGELVFALTRNITFKAAFGSDFDDDQNVFLSILQEFSKLFGAFNIGDFVPWLDRFDLQGLNKRLEKARGSLDRFTDRIIDDHMAKAKGKGEDGSDMVDELLAFLGDQASAGAEDVLDENSAALKLTRENVKAIVMDVMFGGTETVASAIEWVMAELMNNPKEMEKVQDELKREVGLERQVEESDIERLVHLKRVFKETLRLHPPIPVLMHETAEETELLGYRVPARCRVMVNAYAIGRNPEAWPDANKFMPDRFASEGAPDFKGSNFELIPFGSGRRSCPGMQLGLYTLELAVARMVHSFTWALPDGMKAGELDMSDTSGLTAPRAKQLEAVPTPRLL
ncbi:cytochrome P450 84A1-like [Nymphaea colorata]|nr:cytochrome P450 84A1-like [Nymphaea colorata]